MLFLAVPAIGVGSSILLVGEVITPAAALGIILILAGVAMLRGEGWPRRPALRERWTAR
jgi:drug/metabolite transporter (DMT)-like permease